MADSDVPITAGSGTKIDTRTVGAGVDEHRQVVVIGDPSTATAVGTVTAAGGLRVEPYLTNAAGTGVAGFQQEDQPHSDGHAGVMMLGVRNHFTGSTTDGDYSAVSVSSYGDLHTVSRRDLQRISVASGSLTTATTNYAAGDQLGTQFIITGAARGSMTGGAIVGVTLIDAADKIGAVDVVFTDSAITLAADNAAYAISDADALKVVGIVQLAGAYDIGNNRVAQAQNLSIPFVTSGGSALYAGLITRSANGTFVAATDLQLITYVERY